MAQAEPAKRKTLRSFLIMVGLLGLVGFFVWQQKSSQSPSRPFLSIKGQKIYLEVANTPAKISQGLSDRESMPPDRGMLFVFDQPAVRPFWMNRMKFNLDFIFIRDDQIIDLVENMPFPQFDEQPQFVIAKKPFDKVLEVNQGIIQKINAEIGQSITFSI